MRKILLASSALVGVAMLAAPAFAGDLTVKLSGYDTAMLGQFSESEHVDPVLLTPNARNNIGMENLFDINVSVEGKGSNNLDYGAMISLWNGPSYSNNWGTNNVAFVAGGAKVAGAGTGQFSSTSATEQQAYIWMSNNWGKLMLGDAHGATDLFVYAPTVGSNQIDGYYQQFLDLNKVWRAQPTFIDNNESSTRITYYTPKVSGFQGGISYAPDLYSQGLNNNSVSGTVVGVSNVYDNQVEGALAWAGSYDKFNFKVSGLATTAQGNQDVTFAGLPPVVDYLSLGLGGQASYAGFTLGASYTDPGHYGEVKGQGKQQYMATVGGKYDWNQAAFAINFEDGEGYNPFWAAGLPGGALKPGLGAADVDYVRNYMAVGFGATYTWFPGLVSGVDVVLFNQAGPTAAGDDNGEVVLLSQRVNF